MNRWISMRFIKEVLFVFLVAAMILGYIGGISLAVNALTQGGHTCGEFSCDEPAVQALTPDPEYVHNATGDSFPWCKLVGWPGIFGECMHDRPMIESWICTDRSRILLTAEDGKHWCYKPHVNE